ncbi:MAG TPA: cofactor-independent phosphoglycerate mutase [Candidatus Omnitrophota bacterium]|nr:cofactor-independent phosphoglycerate mutase [Candidatus Omnitrophota bacterium]
MTKYLVLIGDGMADLPIKELKGKTPLEVANTPNMDFLAQNGACGWVRNVPPGLTPGSDVAAMSIFGYDPAKYYTGRGPLEAASLGVKLGKDDVAFRCNLVTVKDGKMADFTSGHISTEEAAKIINDLDRRLGNQHVRFVPGLSYRHLVVISGMGPRIADLYCTPPHDITGERVEDHLPSGEGADLVKYLMKESIMPLLEHPVNIKRMRNGKNPASMIWLWGQGASPRMEPYRKIYKKSGAVITAVHLLKGLASLLGLRSIDVPGATGFLDTNYKGKAVYALKALKKYDIVFVHVEAPDEAGHMGDLKGKMKAIEDFDKKVVGPIISKMRNEECGVRILLLPDHPTPISKMTHTSDPVPFVIYDSKIKGKGQGVKGFCEKEIAKSKLIIDHGHRLMGKLLSKA